MTRTTSTATASIPIDVGAIRYAAQFFQRLLDRFTTEQARKGVLGAWAEHGTPALTLALVDQLEASTRETAQASAESERWKERWTATVQDADSQRARRHQVETLIADVQALHAPTALKNVWGNVGAHLGDLPVCGHCTSEDTYTRHPCQTWRLLDGDRA